jgi:hypothetical protein
LPVWPGKSLGPDKGQMLRRGGLEPTAGPPGVFSHSCLKAGQPTREARRGADVSRRSGPTAPFGITGAGGPRDRSSAAPSIHPRRVPDHLGERVRTTFFGFGLQGMHLLLRRFQGNRGAAWSGVGITHNGGFWELA